jgi:hypothetical protein
MAEAVFYALGSAREKTAARKSHASGEKPLLRLDYTE